MEGLLGKGITMRSLLRTTTLATAAALTAALAASGAHAAASPSMAAPPAAAPTGAATADLPAATTATPRGPRKRAVAVGTGGAVSTVDPYATRAALQVLRRGGNATDAAVAAAAMLGVTEPYSAGIGGGGYFVHYDAKAQKVRTIDGRETAPRSMPQNAFIDPATGKPYNFTPELVTSGVSVGTPGTPLTWERALAKWGTVDLEAALAPAIKIADKGFVVDETFRDQTLDNAERFKAFPATRRLYLPEGDAPKVGTRLRNRDLAQTYRLLADKGVRKAFYRGQLASDLVDAVRDPAVSRRTSLPVPPGHMKVRDLRDYKVRVQAPTKVSYRDLDVYGMAPSSSGGTTVGETLAILDRYELTGKDAATVLHHYLEASALAYADRAKYLGDPAFVDVPVSDLLSGKFAAERACGIDPAKAATKPVAAGDASSYDGVCGGASASGVIAEDTENVSTTHLTVADRWGNVVAYTLTIEQTGGSGMVVPGYGFLLNNELTDFSTVYDAADPNRIQPGKRPRSSMSPTIVLRDSKPFLTLGSPGGSTIITTVLQMLINRVDLGMTLPEAVAAPRVSPRNTASVSAEPAFITAYGQAMTALGHTLVPSGDAFTSAAEIGAAAAIEFGPRGMMTAVAEPQRRGGGAAGVVKGH